MNSETIRVLLQEDEMPKAWYNIAADFKHPVPPPVTPDGKPITADMLAPVFPMNLIEQEVSTQRWIPIPEERRPKSTSRTNRFRPAAATRPTPPFRRPITIVNSASSA
jgi:predicted alternative tryptophan synthase beta-subunit